MSSATVLETIAAERASAIGVIHRDTLILNDIARDLAGEVDRQSPFFDQLETNAQTTKAHAERGLEQVQKARDIQENTPGCAVS